MTDFNFYGVGDFIRQYNFKDKKANITSYTVYMLNRTMQMFEYDSLPDTIPKRVLELYLLTNGHAVIVKHNGNLYVCFGGFSGEPDEYYMPKQYIVANPYLKLFKTYNIDSDCVLIRNDSLMYGLIPLFSRYATALVENDISMNMVDINSRIAALIDARDDATKASAEKFLKDVEAGENGVIASAAFFDGLRAQPYSEHSYQILTDLIEYHQYLRASWFNEIGLNANYNMKRESITADESQLNDDMLFPLIDDMLACRQEAIDKINDMFDTNISVRFGSTWYDNEKEVELEQEIMEHEIIGGDDTDDTIDTDEDDISSDDD